MLDPTLSLIISRQRLHELHRAGDAHRMAASAAPADGSTRRLMAGRPTSPAPGAARHAATCSPLAAGASVSRRG